MRGLFAILLLMGCAAVPDAPPLAPEAAPMARWAPEGEPRAVVLALHGFGDHGTSTFDKAAGYWAGEGFLVLAPDQRGFGRNADWGDWPGAAALIEDAGALAARARAEAPDAPLFLLGHSMGGGVALAAERAVRPDGLILAAPAVWGGDQLTLPYRALAWAGATLFPDKRWSGEGVVKIQASDNIEALRALGRDPLVIGKPSSREFMGLIRLMDRAVAAAPEVEAPLLMLYGAKDEVTPEDPVRAAYDAAPGEKEFRYYPDGWHLLFRDLGAEEVWRDVAMWMEDRS